MNLPKTTFRFIFHFLGQQKLKFFILIISFMTWATSDALFPYLLKHIVNTLQLYQNNRAAIYTAIGTVLAFLILLWMTSEFFMRLQGIIQIYTFPKFRASIRAAVFNYVKLHSHEYFSSNFAGNLSKNLSDLPTSSQAITEIVFFQFVTAATGAVIVLTTMWFTKPLFAIILFCWLCFHLTLTASFLKYGNKRWEIHSESVSTLNGKIVDVFTNMLNVRLFARANYEEKYLKNFQQDEIKKSKKAMWLTELLHIGLGLNGLFLIFGMTFTLLYGWVHQWVTLGDFTQIEMQSFWLMGWIWYVSFQMSTLAREMGTIGNALSLIRKGHDITDKPLAKPIIISRGEIKFEDVKFSYQKNKPVFNNLNLIIPAGQKIGLVGFSGSGKTTFVNLILRFYDLKSGQILIDDQIISDITQDSLRSQIAMIPQDPALFHRSLMENIRYGRLAASDEEVIEASKRAHCHEFIEKLDDTYDALVGERGIKLSGGQRQRIAIARAILKNAPILILDEATSSLDSITEKLIQESLNNLMRDRTTIVVAHRLSTLSGMDRIIVFDKGHIIEEGTKESLLEKNGHFAMLWNMQTNGFLPDKNE